MRQGVRGQEYEEMCEVAKELRGILVEHPYNFECNLHGHVLTVQNGDVVFVVEVVQVVMDNDMRVNDMRVSHPFYIYDNRFSETFSTYSDVASCLVKEGEKVNKYMKRQKMVKEL